MLKAAIFEHARHLAPDPPVTYNKIQLKDIDLSSYICINSDMNKKKEKKAQ